MSGATTTPLMQQYREIKSRHQDAILFFRMGEFYEMFYGDAEIASRVLGITPRRVRCAEDRALRHLRASPATGALRDAA